MKNILKFFISVTFLSFIFVGPAFSDPPSMNDSEAAISQDEVKDGESILDLMTPDEAEAAPTILDANDPYDERFDKGDELPFHESEIIDDKIHEEDEKEKTIM